MVSPTPAEDPHVYRTAVVRTLAAVLAAHCFVIAVYRGMVSSR